MRPKGKGKGQPSQIKYNLDQKIIDESKARVADLLADFPLYPELDLNLLLETLPEEER